MTDRSAADRKQRGAWFTPAALTEEMIGWLCSHIPQQGPTLRVVDPACGDGRLLRAVRDALPHRTVHLDGCDIDAATARAADGEGVRAFCADALTHDWEWSSYDIVIGNPPFLSQMAATTTRGRSSSFGGGPYANSAAEFAVLAARLVKPTGGAVVLVLPQTVLGDRDSAGLRAEVDARARLAWSWWERDQEHFDAAVNVCIIGWTTPRDPHRSVPWTSVITERIGVPSITAPNIAGTIGDRCDVGADFRSEYYAMVPAVNDDGRGAPLITSGLIDPGRCWWGARPVRFAKRTFQHPRVDRDLLPAELSGWWRRRLVPKVLVANQTRAIEAVCDPDGSWLPGVPVVSVTPRDGAAESTWQAAAVLSSPVASAAVWHCAGGTGLSTSSVRVRPRHLAAVDWPAGSLDEAVAALKSTSLHEAADSVLRAYGIEAQARTRLLDWWSQLLPNRPQRAPCQP